MEENTVRIMTAEELSEMDLSFVKTYEAMLWKAWRIADKVKGYKVVMEGA